MSSAVKCVRRKKLEPKEARDEMIKTIKNFIKLLREIFRKNRKLASSIDEAYELLLEDQIRLIPNNWIVGTNETVYMLKGMIESIDFIKMNRVIQTSCSKIWFDVDSYSFVVNYLFKALDVSPNAYSVCCNLMEIFRPLCNCIDHIFSHPEEMMQRMADISVTKENADIF